MSDMYTEIILDYYRNPKNYGHMAKADAAAHDVNPLCGDEITMQLKIKKGLIEDIKFNGKGCAISQASASMLTEEVKGKQIEEAAKLGRQDIFDILQIPISVARLKCALLGLKVFKLALYSYIGRQMSSEEKKKLD